VGLEGAELGKNDGDGGAVMLSGVEAFETEAAVLRSLPVGLAAPIGS
jgi:hypothetical protein